MAEKRSLNHIAEGIFSLYDHPLVKALHAEGVTIRGLQQVHFRGEKIPGERIAVTVSSSHVRGKHFEEMLDRIISGINKKLIGANHTIFIGRERLTSKNTFTKQKIAARLAAFGYGPGRELPENWHVIQVAKIENKHLSEKS
jgi:hypothetical protein